MREPGNFCNFGDFPCFDLLPILIESEQLLAKFYLT